MALIDRPLRISDSDLGSIIHRPATPLGERERCQRGHLAPSYAVNRYCVACSKMNAYRWRYGPAGMPPRRRSARRFADYGAARTYHEDRGGYLLVVEDGYLCTDSFWTVRNYRGYAWATRCDQLGCWDETELPYSVITEAVAR